MPEGMKTSARIKSQYKWRNSAPAQGIVSVSLPVGSPAQGRRRARLVLLFAISQTCPPQCRLHRQFVATEVPGVTASPGRSSGYIHFQVHHCLEHWLNKYLT
ncbi:uncharacterized protein WM277_017373 isoform 1-T1 [Molossus nigricans]